MKKKFKILDSPCQYSLSVQSKLVPALGALHNFLDCNGVDSADDVVVSNDGFGERATYSVSEYQGYNPEDRSQTDLGSAVPVAELRAMSDLRDRIAEEMWVDYQTRLDARVFTE